MSNQEISLIYQQISDLISNAQDMGVESVTHVEQMLIHLINSDVPEYDINKQLLQNTIISNINSLTNKHISYSKELVDLVGNLQLYIYKNYGNINTYLSNNGIKVLQTFADVSNLIGFNILAENIENNSSSSSSSSSSVNPLYYTSVMNNVYIEGDSSLMNMGIVSASYTNSFDIETTGARFVYSDGVFLLYQGLDIKENKRLVSTITFEGAPDFIPIVETSDHILLYADNCDIGIYGDSTLIIYPKVELDIDVIGNFTPDYIGQFEGEILLIDNNGGLSLYPQRHEIGYTHTDLNLTTDYSDWEISYTLSAGNRMTVGAFPGKSFDLEMYKNSGTLDLTQNPLAADEDYGKFCQASVPTWDEWIDDEDNNIVKKWTGIVLIWYTNLYAADYPPSANTDSPEGPYIVYNATELELLVSQCHDNNMKVVLYTSYYYWRSRSGTQEDYLANIQQLKDDYNIDGVYIDGLTFEGTGIEHNRIENYEVLRKLRNIFGADGIIYLHGTHERNCDEQSVVVQPNMEAYVTVNYCGEGIPWTSLDEDFVKYQINKYGISNCIGTWCGYWTTYAGGTQIVSATWADNIATITTEEPHGFADEDIVSIRWVVPTIYRQNYTTITRIDDYTFTYPLEPVAPAVSIGIGTSFGNCFLYEITKDWVYNAMIDMKQTYIMQIQTYGFEYYQETPYTWCKSFLRAMDEMEQSDISIYPDVKYASIMDTVNFEGDSNLMGMNIISIITESD